MKPLIGLNVDINVKNPTEARIARTYYEAVEKAGGIPVLIPPALNMSDTSLERLLTMLDGLVLIGGRDYQTSNYGEEPLPAVSLVHADREEFDLRLVKRALKHKKLPILAICGGCQLLNIALGGSLWQDIPGQLPKSVVHRGDGETVTHPVYLLGKLRKIFGTGRLAAVVSAHHQSIKLLGKGLKIASKAFDGVVEGVVLRGRRFVVAVQWHPERDVEGNMPLYAAFVKVASKRAKARKR